jgi:subtilisin family serine protease
LGQTLVTGVSRIKALGKTNKGNGVNVAVIDTGIDLKHPDLAANNARIADNDLDVVHLVNTTTSHIACAIDPGTN